MKTVILLGTAHRVQGAERGICNIEDPDYETLVAQLCREYAVDFIFEEASGLGPTIAEKKGHFCSSLSPIPPTL